MTATQMAVTETESVAVEVARDGARRTARDVLLRCWLRETGVAVPAPGRVAVPLPATASRLDVDVVERRPTGAHVLGAVTTSDGDPVGLEGLVDLLSREAAARTGRADHAEARDRLLESARRMAQYAAGRAAEDAVPDLPRWLLAEQDLLTGHPWHPMTKSRDGLDDALDARFSPEARGSFAVHWFAAAPEVAAHDGAGVDVPALMRRLAGPAARQAPDGWLLVPAHPWQAVDLRHRPAAADLLDAGVLRDLGPAGGAWWATSSLRTVARPDAEVMLKLSMGLRVTNSRRENTRGEGRLAVHTARLVDAGLGSALAAAHPAFDIVADRAWAGVGPDDPGGSGGLSGVGLETVVREAPFTADADIRCAGALLDPRPDLARPAVAAAVARAAEAHGLSLEDGARLWWTRYLDVVVAPVLWLHGTWGIGLEAHLQNTLVQLSPDGLPVRGFYRDNQGWYAAESALPRLRTLLPSVGEDAPLVFHDALVTERVAYYVGVNHVLGVVAALAAACGLPEEPLLRILGRHLRSHRAGARPSPVATLLLEADTLPTKANLLTGVDGRDEVASPVETQSVYVDVPNPLREVLP